MKKTFIILCLFASIATQAQYDTLPYNIGIPNYFTTHTFDSMHVTSHDNRSCVPRATNLITFNNVYESSHSQGLALPVVVPYATEGDFSYGFYPDSTIHIIGMAWFNYIDKLSIGSWDTIDVKLFHPSGNYMMPLVKKRITRDTFSFSKVLDLGRGWDASDITNWSVYNISAPLYEVYFDNEIDISDSLYLSVKFTWSSDGWPKNLDVTAGWTEGHSPIIPDSDPKIYPIQSYRMKDTPGDDDPWTYGEMHAYPLLFPIIRLDGDTCPEVREVRYTRVGNSAAIALPFCPRRVDAVGWAVQLQHVRDRHRGWACQGGVQRDAEPGAWQRYGALRGGAADGGAARGEGRCVAVPRGGGVGGLCARPHRPGQGSLRGAHHHAAGHRSAEAGGGVMPEKIILQIPEKCVSLYSSIPSRKGKNN